MKYSINAQGVPEAFGPYSQGTTAGRLVFAAGQLPIAEGQTDVLVEGGITEQASRVIDLCERLVSEAGCSLSDVARTTVYLRDLTDLDAFNEVYAKYFTSKPARSCVAVKDLPKGVLCEIEAIAEA